MGKPKIEDRDAFEEKVKALRKEGASIAAIAEQLGKGPGTIGYYLYGRKNHRPKGHKTALRHSRNGVVSVLGGPTDKGDEATGFAAGFISGWLGSYASKHSLDANSLTLDVVSILRKEVK